MNDFQKKMILKFGAPLLTRIVTNMLSEENLVKFRDASFEFMRRVARKTETELDDLTVEYAIQFIMEPEKYIKYGHNMIDWAIAYVQASETEWDDFVFFPILTRLKNVAVGLQ